MPATRRTGQAPEQRVTHAPIEPDSTQPLAASAIAAVNRATRSSRGRLSRKGGVVGSQ